MKEIPLTQGKVTLVDDDMFDYLNQWKWYAAKSRNNWYAIRTDYSENCKTTLLMHREIMNTPEGMYPDHIDHNGLNNQRNNLRYATNQQNQMNNRPRANCSSQFKGVSWHIRKKKWICRIRFDGKLIHIGYFHSENEAALSYNAKAIELFGEFAYLNQIKKVA